MAGSLSFECWKTFSWSRVWYLANEMLCMTHHLLFHAGHFLENGAVFESFTDDVIKPGKVGSDFKNAVGRHCDLVTVIW